MAPPSMTKYPPAGEALTRNRRSSRMGTRGSMGSMGSTGSWEAFDEQAGERYYGEVIKKLKRLSNEAMEEEIPLWGGTKLRKEGLFAYIGEVYHHKGQVTYIRGTHKRLNE